MNIITIIIISLFLFLIKSIRINCTNNNSLTMLILPSSLLIHNRLPRYLNLTGEYISTTTNRIQTFDISVGYNTIKDVSTLTKTQIKVIITVVLIISFIMFIIAIFRFKNACRNQENDNFQTDIIRNRASQYSEPSSRRGSVGYYTQRYNRTTNIRFDDQLNTSLPAKRLSIPACDQSSKSTTVVVLSSLPKDTTVTTDVTHHHNHVTSSCDTSNIPNQEISIDIKPVTYNKSDSGVAINHCDDQTPLLRSELASTIKDSLNHSSTRKYSLNALLPLIRPSTSHPFCSSLTSTIADGNHVDNSNAIDLKSRRRASLSSSLRRTTFAKQPRIFCSTIDSLTTTKTSSSTPIQPTDSDHSEHKSSLKNLTTRKKSSSITPSETISLSSYPKNFMQKIERFRFIDDSSSSTTTVTSPIESIEQDNNYKLKHTIDQFDDFLRIKYPNNDDEVNSLIDCLNEDLLMNSSYSDLNILNKTKPILRPQTIKPVNEKLPFHHQHYQSMPINIPHSITSLPLAKQRNHIDINGHSKSMDFQPIPNRRDYLSAIPDTSSSSSTMTLTSIRSSTSLEFDDNTKPSGVLVDDDFLPMSSPVDELFWDMTIRTSSSSSSSQLNHSECFPNVGSSPVIEVKHFDLQQLNTLSETSCDEDDDDDDSTSSNNQPEKFTIKELPKPLMVIKSISPIQPISGEMVSTKSESDPSINSTEQYNINTMSPSLSSDQMNDQSLLETSSNRSDFFCETNLSSSSPTVGTIAEEDESQESSPNDISEGDDSPDNGEIDLVQEFELSQKEEAEQQIKTSSINDDDLSPTQQDIPTTINRLQPTSIMKITHNIKSTDNILPDEQPQQTLKPKVRFNLDPQYEREREWNKVNKLLGNSVEWTDEFEV